MPVGDFFEDFCAEQFSELHNALLVTRGAEMAALAGKGQQIFVAAAFAFDAGKAVVRIAAIQIPMNNVLQIRPPVSVLPREMLIVNLYERLKAVLDAAIIIRFLWFSGAINSSRKRHDISPSRISCRHNVERTFYLSRIFLRKDPLFR